MSTEKFKLMTMEEVLEMPLPGPNELVHGVTGFTASMATLLGDVSSKVEQDWRQRELEVHTLKEYGTRTVAVYALNGSPHQFIAIINPRKGKVTVEYDGQTHGFQLDRTRLNKDRTAALEALLDYARQQLNLWD
jgi:hypothetical protein